MEIREIMKNNVAALVEYYDDSSECKAVNDLVEEVKKIMGADAPVYRVNVADDPRVSSLVHLKSIPTIIIYRNSREEWIITEDWPTAGELAERLRASMEAPGAVNPLKGHPRGDRAGKTE